MEKDITHEDYTVIPKGRILASLSVYDTTPTGGIRPVSQSGVLFGFVSQTQANTTGSYSQDGSYFGYDDYISNLIIPANGGTPSNFYYTQLDVDAGTYKADGTFAAAGETFVVPANAPVGVAFHDWFQDIRGKYLNYRMWPDGGHILTDWYVEVPYVIESSGVVQSVRAQELDSYATREAFRSVASQYAYMTVNGITEKIVPGMYVKSDAIGNYMPQDIAGLVLTSTMSVQTVGKVIGIDTRFPKSALNDVQTYPGSRMPGTQTAGLPSFLFEFIVATETINGNTPTLQSIVGLVTSGKYGIARIQLLVS